MHDWAYGQKPVIMPNIALGVLKKGKSCEQLFVYPQKFLSQVYMVSYGWGQFAGCMDFQVFPNLDSVSLHLA